MPAFDADLIERYRKVRALAERGGTDGEKAAARNVLASMEDDHPGLGAAVAAADAEPRVRRRESPPPPAPSWSVHEVPDPPPRPRPGFVPGYNPYAPPPGYGAVHVDPDAFNGNPWRTRPSRVVVVSRSRWADPEPHSPFMDDGTLPGDYGSADDATAAQAWRRR